MQTFLSPFEWIITAISHFVNFYGFLVYLTTQPSCSIEKSLWPEENPHRSMTKINYLRCCFGLARAYILCYWFNINIMLDTQRSIGNFDVNCVRLFFFALLCLEDVIINGFYFTVMRLNYCSNKVYLLDFFVSWRFKNYSIFFLSLGSNKLVLSISESIFIYLLTI